MKLKIKRLQKLDVITIESTCLQRLEVLTSNKKGCGRNNYPYDRQRAAGRDRVDLCLWLAVYVPYSVLVMAWSGEQRDFVVELFIQMADRQ